MPSTEWHQCYIGLGSNLDDPVVQLQHAVQVLQGLPVLRAWQCSRFYASAPIGPQDQPDFINAVARFETCLSPLLLLDQLQAIEQMQRRRRERHWGPRTLDLDLLLYDALVLESERLRVPHPCMTERRFVLEPLLELAPELCLPDGRVLRALLPALMEQAITRLE